MTPQKPEPVVTQENFLDMQVCVPKGWSDAQVLTFAELNYPCGTMNGWHIRKDLEGLAGDPERQQCSDSTEMCHIMLDA